MSNWHGGKGSKRRNSNEKAYADNWDLIWKNKKDTDDEDSLPDVEVLEEIVNRELKKMEKYKNESEK